MRAVKRGFDPIDGVAEVRLREIEVGATIDGLTEMGCCAVREEAGTAASENHAAPDECSDGIVG